MFIPKPMSGSSSLKGKPVEVFGPTATPKLDAPISNTLTVDIGVLMVVMVAVECVYRGVDKGSDI